MDRRRFLKLTGAGLAGGALASTAGAVVSGAEATDGMPALHLFSKHLQFLDYPAMANAAAALGFAGLDLTVRPGGHVEPDNFERDLPAAIGAIKDTGLKCVMMTSDITDAANPRDKALLALAGSLGVKYYRLGFMRYQKDETPLEGVARYRDQLAALAAWNCEIGITGLVQNHSGADRFGAAVWDACLALEGQDPEHLGMQFDIRHATTDGGLMWPTTLRLAKPHIRSLIFKDFKWAKTGGEWRLVNTPIGAGMVDFKRYFRMLKEQEMHYPVSLHCEYDLGGAEKGKRELSVPVSAVLAAIGRDVGTIRELWAEA